MADYDDAVEGSLLAEEQVIEAGEALDQGGDESGRGHFHTYLSFYISGISLVVAVAALLTALAADQSMEMTLAGLADLVESNGLRVELRCHEIQRDLAELRSGGDGDAAPAESHTVSEQLTHAQYAGESLEREATHTGNAHYVLAVGITFLQMATALAATTGITKKHHLLVPSGLFALGGLGLTVAGAVDYLA